jgi:hypothetical protein
MSNITIYRLNTTEFICAELRKINSCTNSAMIAKSVSANIDEKKFYKGNNATAINNNLPRRSPFQNYTLIIGRLLWYIPNRTWDPFLSLTLKHGSKAKSLSSARSDTTTTTSAYYDREILSSCSVSQAFIGMLLLQIGPIMGIKVTL